MFSTEPVNASPRSAPRRVIDRSGARLCARLERASPASNREAARKGAKKQRGIVTRDSKKDGFPCLFGGCSSEGPQLPDHFQPATAHPVGGHHLERAMTDWLRACCRFNFSVKGDEASIEIGWAWLIIAAVCIVAAA